MYLVERATVTHTFHRYQRKSTGSSKYRCLFQIAALLLSLRVRKFELHQICSEVPYGVMWSPLLFDPIFLDCLRKLGMLQCFAMLMT